MKGKKKPTNILRMALGLLIVALFVSLGFVPTVGAAPSRDFVLFSKPAPLKRIVTDPWAEGLWLATDAGAFFWSHESETVSHLGPREGLPTHVINDVAPTPTEVWFATHRGISILSRATGQFDQVRHENGSLLQVATRYVEITRDTAWVTAETNGLFKVDIQARVAVPVNNPVNGSRWSHAVYDVWADGDELFLSVLGYGLVQWNLVTGDATVHKHNLLMPIPLYYRIHGTPDYVFVGTNGDGLVRFRRSDANMVEFVGPQNTNSPAIAGMTQLGSELWMGTVSGVTRYDLRTQAWRNYQQIPGNAVMDLSTYAGSVFGASRDGGVIVYDRATDTWKDSNWWTLADRPGHNVVRGCDPDGNRLVFSTGGGGANFFDPATDQWSVAGSEPGDTGRPRDILVYGAATDAAERWYAHAKGLTRHNLTTGAWANYRTDGRHPSLSRPVWTFDVKLTPTDVWAATQSDSPDSKNDNTWQPGNLARMNRATDQWTYYGPADGLSDENVTVLETDGTRIWVGTFSGLDVFDTTDNSIRHVLPAQGRVPVQSLAVDAGRLWVGTLGRLFAVDRATLEIQEIVPFRGQLIRSLSSSNDQLWVGTEDGLVTYLPATGQTQSFVAETAHHPVYCSVVHDGTLYAGTPFGVKRLDIAALSWLAQADLVGGDNAPAAGMGTASISISSPSADAPAMVREPLAVAGSADGPAGATVEVRIGRGAWTTAESLGSWSASVPVPSMAPGVVYVTARVRSEGTTLAQTSVPVTVQWPQDADPGAQAGGIQFYHEPLHELAEGRDAMFEVGFSPDSDEVGGTVTLTEPTGSVTALPLMKSEPGQLVATYTAISAGVWNYTISLNVSGQALSLPGPEEGVGASYELAVRAAHASITIGGEGRRVVVAPRQSTTFQVPITNSLPDSVVLHLVTGGEAGSWVKPLSPITLPSTSGAQFINVTVTPPKSRTSGMAELIIRGTVEGLPDAQPSVTLKLLISSSTAAGGAAAAGGEGGDASDGGFVAAPSAGIVAALLFTYAWFGRRKP